MSTFRVHRRIVHGMIPFSEGAHVEIDVRPDLGSIFMLGDGRAVEVSMQDLQRWIQGGFLVRVDSARTQIERLATFIMDEVPGEPSQDQGAIDTAIRIIRTLMAERGQVFRDGDVVMVEQPGSSWYGAEGRITYPLGDESIGVEFHRENEPYTIVFRKSSLRLVARFVGPITPATEMTPKTLWERLD